MWLRAILTGFTLWKLFGGGTKTYHRRKRARHRYQEDFGHWDD